MEFLRCGGRAADLTSVALHCKKEVHRAFSDAAVGLDLHIYI